MGRCSRCGRELHGPYGCSSCDQKAVEAKQRESYERERESQRNRDHAEKLQRESAKVQQDLERDRDRAARARDEEAFRRTASLEQAKLNALAEIEEKKLQREERLQEKAQSDKERFEIRKSLQEVALLTVSDLIRANRSFRVLLSSGLFKEYAEFVKKEIASNPVLLSLLSQILDENALEEAKSIMNSITMVDLLPKLLELQNSDDERVVVAITKNRMPDNKFGIKLGQIIVQRIEVLAKQINGYLELVEKIYSSEKLGLQMISLTNDTLSELAEDGGMAFKYYYSLRKSWESLISNGKVLFPKKVNQILSSLDHNLDAKKLDVAKNCSGVVLEKMLKQEAFAKAQASYIDLQQKNVWDNYFYPFFYAVILYSIASSYFELDLVVSAGLTIILVIALLLIGYNYLAKKKRKESLRIAMAELIRSHPDDSELISSISIGLDKIIASIRKDLADVKTRIINFYYQEQIDLGEDIQNAFRLGSAKLEKYSRDLLKTTCDLAKMVACQKVFDCEFLGSPVETPIGKLHYSFSISKDEANRLGKYLAKNEPVA